MLPPPEMAGLTKGFLTIGFPQEGRLWNHYFWGGMLGGGWLIGHNFTRPLNKTQGREKCLFWPRGWLANCLILLDWGGPWYVERLKMHLLSLFTFYTHHCVDMFHNEVPQNPMLSYWKTKPCLRDFFPTSPTFETHRLKKMYSITFKLILPAEVTTFCFDLSHFKTNMIESHKNIQNTVYLL